MININEINFDKMNGLIPTIVTDYKTKLVLMLGFMNKESLEKTIYEKKVTFYSRSKNRLWTKGETSGNYLNTIRISADCDNDSLLIEALPEGNTCHLDNYSCFGIEPDESIYFLQFLNDLIKKRKNELPENSYTTKLFNAGKDRIIQKVGEEAVETVIAAKNSDKNEIINEVSDLIFHLIVMLTNEGIELKDIAVNLYKRHNQ